MHTTAKPLTVDTQQVDRMWRNIHQFHRSAAQYRDAYERLRATRAAIPARRPSNLTDREVRILRMIASGADNERIASDLHFGLGTIKLHVRTILEKLGAGNRTEAAVRAVRLGII